MSEEAKKIEWLLPVAGAFNATDEYYRVGELDGKPVAFIYSLGNADGLCQIEANWRGLHRVFPRSEAGLIDAKQWCDDRRREECAE